MFTQKYYETKMLWMVVNFIKETSIYAFKNATDVQAILFSLQKKLAEGIDLRQHYFLYAPSMPCT